MLKKKTMKAKPKMKKNLLRATDDEDLVSMNLKDTNPKLQKFVAKKIKAR